MVRSDGCGSARISLKSAILAVCIRSICPAKEKIHAIAAQVYGADGVDFSKGVRDQLAEISRRGDAGLPVCVATTQYSLSHDPKTLGRPSGFRLPVREVRLSAGAGFVLALTEGISLMPGLPGHPAARGNDLPNKLRE